MQRVAFGSPFSVGVGHGDLSCQSLICFSKAELAVRSEAHEIKVIVIGLAVYQDEIRPKMAVTMIGPLTDKRMVPMTLSNLPVRCQVGHHMGKIRIKMLGEPPPSFRAGNPAEKLWSV